MRGPPPLPDSMHAVRVHGPGDLRVDRIPLPRLDAGDALVRVLAAGVCATDRKLAARGAPDGAVRTLGHEIVGEVSTAAAGGPAHGTRVAIAPNLGEGSCPACLRGATNLCPEYRAFGIHLDGGMAEYLRVPRAALEAGHLLPVPEGLSEVSAVLLEPLACCLDGLEASGLRPGESLLVIAAGVMGRLHVVAARALGAGRIVVVDPVRERLAHASALGADVTLELGEGDDLVAAVAAAGGDQGVDVAAVTFGDPRAAEAALACLARGGRMNLFAGFAPETRMVALDANAIHYRGLQVLGTTGASKPTLARALDLLHGGRLELSGMVSAVRGLCDAPRAFAEAGEREHARVVLVPAARGAP